MSDYGRGDGPYPDRPNDPWGRDDAYPSHPSSPYGPPEQYGRPPAQYHPDRAGSGDRYGGYGDPDPAGYREPGGYQHPGHQSPGYREPGYHEPGHPEPGYRDAAGYPGSAGYPPVDAPAPVADPRQPPSVPWDPPAPRPAKRSPTGLIITLVAALVIVLCGGGGLALYLLNSKDSSTTAQPKPPGGAGNAAAPSGNPTASAAGTPSYDPSSIIKGQCVANDGTEDVPRLRVVGCAAGSYLVLARFDGTADTKKCSTVAGSTHDYFYETTPGTLDFVLCLKKQ
jgi:hypothetical protein